MAFFAPRAAQQYFLCKPSRKLSASLSFAIRYWRNRRAAALFAFMLTACISFAEPPPRDFPRPMNAAEIQRARQKLIVLGGGLYGAAHPDDENTNLIALGENGSLYDTAYLS